MPENDEPTEDPVDEFLRDLSHVMHDDALTDLLGEGHTLEVPGDQALVDMLGGWRAEIDSEPLAQIAEQALRGEHPPSGPTPPDTGETMSGLSEIAQQVQDQSDVQEIAAAITQAEQLIKTKYETLGGLLADTAQRHRSGRSVRPGNPDRRGGHSWRQLKSRSRPMVPEPGDRPTTRRARRRPGGGDRRNDRPDLAGSGARGPGRA